MSPIPETEAANVLVTVATSGVLEVATNWEENVSAAGKSVRRGTYPVPDSCTNWGLFTASSAMVSVAY